MEIYAEITDKFLIAQFNEVGNTIQDLRDRCERLEIKIGDLIRFKKEVIDLNKRLQNIEDHRLIKELRGY